MDYASDDTPMRIGVYRRPRVGTPCSETAALGAIENSPGGRDRPPGVCSRGRDAQETKRSSRHRAASVSRRRITLGWACGLRLRACNRALLGAAVGEHHVAIGRISFGETTRTGPRRAGVGAGRCRAAGWNRVGAAVVSYRVGWAAPMPGAVSTVPSTPAPSTPTGAPTPAAQPVAPTPSTPMAAPMAAPVPPSRCAGGRERGGAERCECCKCKDRFACEHEYLLFGCRAVRMRQPSRLLVQEPLWRVHKSARHWPINGVFVTAVTAAEPSRGPSRYRSLKRGGRGRLLCPWRVAAYGDGHG